MHSRPFLKNYRLEVLFFRQGLYEFSKVLENDNAIIENLENFGKNVFEMAIDFCFGNEQK